MKMNTLGLHRCPSLAGLLTAARKAHRSTMTVPAPWAQQLSPRLSVALNSSKCEKNDISALKIQPLYLFIFLVICKFPNYPWVCGSEAALCTMCYRGGSDQSYTANPIPVRELAWRKDDWISGQLGHFLTYSLGTKSSELSHYPSASSF